MLSYVWGWLFTLLRIQVWKSLYDGNPWNCKLPSKHDTKHAGIITAKISKGFFTWVLQAIFVAYQNSTGWSVVSPTEVPKCAKLCKNEQNAFPTKSTRSDLRQQLLELLDTLTSYKKWKSTQWERHLNIPSFEGGLGSTTIRPSFPHPRTESNWATLVQLMEVHFCHVASCRIRIRDANLAGKLPLVLRILDRLPHKISVKKKHKNQLN